MEEEKGCIIVPAPMCGWDKAKATSSSAPFKEEEEEMVGPPRAMEEEEEGPMDWRWTKTGFC